MLKCTPVEMRKNLNLVELMKKGLIDFVPVPVKSVHDKQKLLVDVFEMLEEEENV